MRTILHALPSLVLAVLATAATAQSTAPTAPPDQAGQARAEAGPAPVIRDGDAAMSCVQIADEAALLSQRMGGAPGGGVLGSLGGVARAGASMLIPGAGLVMAGADALTQDDRDRRTAEAAAVQHRWYYLNGLHDGRDCRQTADAGAAAPAPPSAN